MKAESTIAAIASPPGTGAISIVRMSGKEALEIGNKIFTPNNGKPLSNQRERMLCYGKIMLNSILIDHALGAVFRKPHSYTGEDMVEIYCHGSPYIQQQILHAMLLHGAKMAQAGEFTLMAFVNQKLDLAQAEGVDALISAQTAAMHGIAMQQMRGGFSAGIKKLRQQVLEVMSLVELELDFMEEDVQFAAPAKLLGMLGAIVHETQGLASSFASGNAIKAGIPVVLCGKPNAGKSSLFNALLCEERTLVSAIAGTTRDAVEAALVIEGGLFRIIDTAGLHQSADILENMSMQRSRERIEQAHAILWIADCMQDVADIAHDVEGIAQEFGMKKNIVLINKSDLLDEVATKRMVAALQSMLGNAVAAVMAISAKNGAGLAALRHELAAVANIPLENCMVSNMRHYDTLRRSGIALAAAMQAIETASGADIAASWLRTASHALGEITGEITNDEILNNIFSKFCIGK
jgi:tRNA modification GTPase